MLITLEIYMKTPNTQDFCQKIIQFEHFMQNTPKTWEISMRFFQKFRKFAKLSIQLTPNLAFLIEKL